MRKLKIGYIPMFRGTARGDREILERISKELTDLSRTMDFDLKIGSEIVFGYDTAVKAVSEMNSFDPDFTFLGSYGATIGSAMIPMDKLKGLIGLWAVPEWELTGRLPLNAFCGSMINAGMLAKFHTEKHIPFKWFYGYTDDPLFIDRFKVTFQALKAIVALQESRIGLIGPVVDGFDYMLVRESSIYDLYGATVDRHHSVEEVIKRAKDQSEAAVKDELAAILAEGPKTCMVDDEAMNRFARLSLALSDLARDNGLNAISMSCWTNIEFNYGNAPCSAISRLNNKGIIAGCEADIDGAIGMIISRAMADADAATMCDLVSVDRADDSLNIWHCGPAAGCLANKCGVKWDHHFDMGHYEGDEWHGYGVVADLTFKPGDITLSRISTEAKELTAFGATMFDKESYQGCSGWIKDYRMGGKPMTLAELLSVIYNNRVDHHMSFAYGNFESSLIEFANWKGISVAKNTGYVDHMELGTLVK